LTVHSFHIVALNEGLPLYHRIWTSSATDPTLLSGFLASLEHMAMHIASQHVNVVTMKDYRFFFQIDNENGLLLVFVTDTSENPSRFRKYLAILNRQFVQRFGGQLSGTPLTKLANMKVFDDFDDFVDKLVVSWQLGEATLTAAKVMDVLEVYTLFLNTILQRFLDDEKRKTYWERIQEIFRRGTAIDQALQPLHVDPRGVVYYEEVDPHQVSYPKLRKALHGIFSGLVALARRVLPRQEYQSLVFEHLSPLQRRLKAYQLTTSLVREIL